MNILTFGDKRHKLYMRGWTCYVSFHWVGWRHTDRPFLNIMLNDYIKTFIQFILPKRHLTLWCGWLANCKHTRIKNWLICQFIKTYQVNMDEALYPDPSYYSTFNDFFIRHLNPTRRTLSSAPFVSPVDGIISQFGTIEQNKLIQAKGRFYDLNELLQDPKSVPLFTAGKFATLYLSPKDYHRIHMPIDGLVKRMIYIPGQLFSVQPTTTRMIPKLFSKNERVVVFFDTPYGEMAMILVGAVIVGKIATHWHGEFKRSNQIQYFDYQDQTIFLRKGEEMGYFKLGSTVILLLSAEFQPFWDQSLKENQEIKLFQTLAQIPNIEERRKHFPLINELA